MDSQPKIPNPPPSSDTKQSLHLPAEIIEEILSKLAVKSLLQLRCVSKSWRSLIDSKRFIKTHLEYSTKDPSFAHHRIVLGNQLKQYSLRSLLNDSNNDPSPLAGPGSFRPASVKIVGCCNGLVCIVERRRWRFFMWNPATRISHELPELIENVEIIENEDIRRWINIFSGFGWDERSGAYKVFVNMQKDKCDRSDGSLTKVYSSETNSWKTLEPSNSEMCSSDSFCKHMHGKFVGGKLNWSRSKTGENDESIRDIATFDLKSEAFGEMDQPAQRASFGAWLGVLGGCLSIVYDYKRCLDLWVMKEYGVKESWTKVMEVPLIHVPCLNLPAPYMAPLFIGLNGEILLIYGPYFLVYHPQRLQIKNINGMAKTISPIYTESLVSPVTKSVFG